MAFSKKTYVSGQTAITADNLNAIQDELIDLKNGGLDNYFDTYLKNRCKYYSVSDNISASTTGTKYGSPLTIVEPGIYFVAMTDPVAENVFTFNFIVKDGLNAHADFMSWVNDSLASITFWASEKNRIEVDYGLGAGSTIELYKLN